MITKDVLMSADNPNGHKLEDLLLKLRDELYRKNHRIKDDKSPTALTVLANNRRILSLLSVAEELQRDTIKALAALAPDQGPLGRPRIGVTPEHVEVRKV